MPKALESTNQNPADSTAIEISVPAPIVNFDVEFVRMERSLLQIGFFGSHDPRQQKQSRRRIEQTVNREGSDLIIASEFETPLRLGLPSTADLDKFMVFMRLAAEQRAREGTLVNPIRFSGARMLSELGISDSGSNYDAIDTWCDRMRQTNIKSDLSVFLSRKRQYANQSMGVFRSFRRDGEEESGGRRRRRHDYLIVLEDWLLDNLNSDFIVIEDFNSYIRLVRPVAKGMFGHLLLWFKASNGKKVEKDYIKLCALLNIKPYHQLSRIKDNLGPSLDELKAIGYISDWEIALMSSRDGYKIVMWIGEYLSTFLGDRCAALTQSGTMLLEATVGKIGHKAAILSSLTPEQRRAYDALVDYGVAPVKATELARGIEPDIIFDQMEYVNSIAEAKQGPKIRSRQGFLIYLLDQGISVPKGFVTTRIRNAAKATEQAQVERQQAVYSNRLAYDSWVETQIQGSLKRRYSDSELQARLKDEAEKQSKLNQAFAQIPAKYRPDAALQIIINEIREDLDLPTFEDWCKTHVQFELFNGN